MRLLILPFLLTTACERTESEEPVDTASDTSEVDAPSSSPSTSRRFPTPCETRAWYGGDTSNFPPEAQHALQFPYTVQTTTLDADGLPQRIEHMMDQPTFPGLSADPLVAVFQHDEQGRVTEVLIHSHDARDLADGTSSPTTTEMTFSYDGTSPDPSAVVQSSTDASRVRHLDISRGPEGVSRMVDSVFADDADDAELLGLVSHDFTYDGGLLTDVVTTTGLDESSIRRELHSFDHDDQGRLLRVQRVMQVRQEFHPQSIHDYVWNGSEVEIVEEDGADPSVSTTRVTHFLDGTAIDESWYGGQAARYAPLEPSEPGGDQVVTFHPIVDGVPDERPTSQVILEGPRPELLGPDTRMVFVPPWTFIHGSRNFLSLEANFALPQLVPGLPALLPDSALIEHVDHRDHPREEHVRWRVNRDEAGNHTQLVVTDGNDVWLMLEHDYSCYAPFVDEMPERLEDVPFPPR